MRKNFIHMAFLLMASFLTIATLAQQNFTITGNIKNATTQEFVPAVSILVKGTNQGAFTDDRGHFKITVLKLPVTLVISSIGFENTETVVSSIATPVSVSITPTNALAQDVVVSASRVAERILESPVSIERVNTAMIRNSPAASYYDIVGNLKGVDLVTASLLFKTPSTRGFNTSGNLRLNQLVDGMDNQAPGLNFAVGTLVGITELDVENMELLSGASSALYGPGGMNGTLLINSKNPFKYQGFSIQVKQGVTHVDERQRDASGYYDWTVRWAKQISEKFAFKVGGQYIKTKDWVATDYRNYTQSQNPSTGSIKSGDRSDPNYNGVNVYGDETTLDIRASSSPFLQGIIQANPQLAGILAPYLANPLDISRTGYTEPEVLDPTVENLKLHAGLHYKITPSTEASLVGYWGSGSMVYTGSDRYSLKDVKIGQYKLEFRNANWFARAYTTQEDAGESFNATVTTRLFNEAWKPSFNAANPAGSWYPQYAGAFAAGAASTFQQAYSAAVNAGQSQAQAQATAQATMLANTQNFHNAARAFADQGRPASGSEQFKTLFNQVRSVPISQGGGLFLDKSNLYMVEGQYNFSSLVKFAEVLVGANFKQYVLNSEGTLFADTAGRIKINEVGTYASVSKKLFNDVLKLTASGRYDKNSNFAGRFTPRFSAVITVAKDNNIRLSYQQAYRFPSTQNQWINLNVGTARLIGGLPQLRDYYKFNTNPVYTPESVAAFGASFQAGNPNPGLLKQQTFGEYKPESATSYEIGYKGLVAERLLIDVYGYYSKYKDFLGRIVAIQAKNGLPAETLTPGTRNVYSVSVNSATTVNTQGWGVSLEYQLPANFYVNANFYSDEIKNVPANFVAMFNAPKYRTNIGFSNNGLGAKKRFGFSFMMRYQDEVRYEGDFGTGTIPSFVNLDGQINYRFPQTKSMIKLGANNLLNNYYRTAFGNPEIGGLYYVSFGYNIF